MALPVVETSAFALQTSDAGTSVVVTKPTGTVEGDLLVAATATDANQTASIVMDTGFTNFTGMPNAAPGGDATLISGWKTAGASEGANYTTSWGAGQEGAGVVARVSGANASPENIAGETEGTDTAPTAPDITTTVNDCLLFAIHGADHHDVTTDTNYPTGYTGIKHVESTSTTGACTLGVAHKDFATAGATGTAAFTLDASQQWQSLHVAIAPAAAAGGAADTMMQSIARGIARGIGRGIGM